MEEETKAPQNFMEALSDKIAEKVAEKLSPAKLAEESAVDVLSEPAEKTAVA